MNKFFVNFVCFHGYCQDSFRGFSLILDEMRPPLSARKKDDRKSAPQADQFLVVCIDFGRAPIVSLSAPSSLVHIKRTKGSLWRTMSSASTSSGRWQGQRGRGRGRGRGQGQGDFTARGTSPFSPGGNRGRGHFEAARGTYRGAGASGGRPGGASVHSPCPPCSTLADGVRRHHSIFMQDRPGTIDARIRDGSDKAVVASLNKVDDDSYLSLRPDFGTQGREISLRANYFPVEVKGQIYRYSAAIALPGHKKLARRVKQRVFQLAEQTVDWQQAGMPGRVAHDSAERLVASILLPQPLTIRGTYHEEEDDPPSEGGSEYALTLTFEEEVDQQILNEYNTFDDIPEPSDIASIQLPCRDPCRLSSAFQGPFRTEPCPDCRTISNGNQNRSWRRQQEASRPAAFL